MGSNDSHQVFFNKNDIDYDYILAHIKDDSYRYIGRGSGRNVYDLNNNYVAKVARNRKGIAQNKVEYYISTQGGEVLLVQLIDISEDSNIVIMEKADKIERIQIVYEYYNIKNSRELYRLDEIGDLSKCYDLVLRDFRSASNWGMINGVPKIVDYGFTREVRRRYYGMF